MAAPLEPRWSRLNNDLVETTEVMFDSNPSNSPQFEVAKLGKIIIKFKQNNYLNNSEQTAQIK